MQAAGQVERLAPLVINMELCVTDEVVRANLSATLQRPYIRFNELIEAYSGAVSIVGSGPSIAKTHRSFVGDVVACNGALKYLLDLGVVPKFAMFMDADPVVARFAVPHPDVTYLVASRCHEGVFEKLRGCKVVVWHAKCDAALDELLIDRMEPMIHGGSACVTRAMCVVHAMGYREQHLFGADSSCKGEETHAMGSLVPERYIDIFIADTKPDEKGLVQITKFHTTPWLAAQVEDFMGLAPALETLGNTFVIHGGGLLPHVARAMGYEVRDDSNSLEDQLEPDCI